MKTTMKMMLLGSIAATLGVGCAADDSHLRVRGAVEAQRDELSACYADVLEMDRDADGAVQVAFTMDEDGSVDDVTIENDTIRDEDLPVCISTALHRVEMREPPSQQTRLAYTLRFRPRD